MAGLATTFDFLANTDNEAAAPVLVAALDAAQREVRDLALTALLARRNAAAELNVLRRWPELSPRLQQHLADEIAAPRDYRIRRDPQLQRNHLMGALEKAATQFPIHGRRELLEAVLLLAN